MPFSSLLYRISGKNCFDERLAAWHFLASNCRYLIPLFSCLCHVLFLLLKKFVLTHSSTHSPNKAPVIPPTLSTHIPMYSTMNSTHTSTKTHLTHSFVRSFVRSFIQYYIICRILRAFLLVLSYNLLEGRRIDDVIIGNFLSLLYKTNRFHVAVRLFSNRSQKTSKCGENISDTFLFLPYFDVICDLLLNRRTATWYLQ